MDVLKEGAKKGIPLAAVQEAITPVDQPNWKTPVGSPFGPETPMSEKERQELQMKGLTGGPFAPGEGPMGGVSSSPVDTNLGMPVSAFPRSSFQPFGVKEGGSIPFQTGAEVPAATKAPTYANFYVDPDETKRRLLAQSENSGLSNVMKNKLNMMANPQIMSYAKNLEEEEKALLGQMISKQEEDAQAEETPLEEEFSAMQSPEEDELQSVYKGTFTPEGHIAEAGGTFGIKGKASNTSKSHVPLLGTFGGGAGTTFSRHEGGSIPEHLHPSSDMPEDEQNVLKDYHKSITGEIEDQRQIEKIMKSHGYIHDPTIPWDPVRLGYVPFSEYDGIINEFDKFGQEYRWNKDINNWELFEVEAKEGGLLPSKKDSVFKDLNELERASLIRSEKDEEEEAQYWTDVLGRSRLKAPGHEDSVWYNNNPVPLGHGIPPGYPGAQNLAEGGQPSLEGGSFVLPADVVSGIGDGSSEEGHDILSKWFEMDEEVNNYAYGGQSMLGSPLQGQIKGPGGGLDDLIQTSIDGVKSARVSNDEFVVPSATVDQLGGPEKLYALMKNVRKSRNGTTKQAPSISNIGMNSLMNT